MSNSMETSSPVEAIAGTGSLAGSAPSVVVSSDWNADLAKMAADTQAPPAQPQSTTSEAVVTPPAVNTAIPAPQAVVPPVADTVKPAEVPEKFRGADGKLDQDKVLKSYYEASKALGQKTNELNQIKAQAVPPTPATPNPQAPQAVQAQLSPFELRVAQDLFSQGGFTEQQAVAQARVMVKLTEAKHRADTAATFAEVNQFRETLAQQQQQVELESLAKNPKTNWVLSPEGYAEMVKAREENPELNNSATPWKAAAIYVLGLRALHGQPGLVNIPTPTGTQQSAPPLPVVPAQVAQNPIALNTPEQIRAHVSGLSKEQEAEFWTKMGLKWDSPKSYKGI